MQREKYTTRFKYIQTYVREIIQKVAFNSNNLKIVLHMTKKRMRCETSASASSPWQ